MYSIRVTASRDSRAFERFAYWTLKATRYADLLPSASFSISTSIPAARQDNSAGFHWDTPIPRWNSHGISHGIPSGPTGYPWEIPPPEPERDSRRTPNTPAGFPWDIPIPQRDSHRTPSTPTGFPWDIPAPQRDFHGIPTTTAGFPWDIPIPQQDSHGIPTTTAGFPWDNLMEPNTPSP